MRTDEEIKRDVEDELRWEPDLDATDIEVRLPATDSRPDPEIARDVSAVAWIWSDRLLITCAGATPALIKVA